MIDVLLVLLIFFMSIITAQVEQLDNEVKLPVAPDSAQGKPNPDERTVNVRYNDTDGTTFYTYGGKQWDDKEALVEELKRQAEMRPHPKLGTRLVVKLRPDKRTPAKDVYGAMQIVAQATAKIAFVATNR